ncbi:hypothetical protein XF_0695 [Xylella fastidiosa 9a5c]|uniref:Uncharacterized protein n=1 Tax=Xylella fastidiosa (strain 9a5c) TaxID=160492 RepID=Q9PFG4_XYLFA|nr:hypothetical protein XF_0695 [Xylella fastidiosa 9a5c]
MFFKKGAQPTGEPPSSETALTGAGSPVEVDCGDGPSGHGGIGGAVGPLGGAEGEGSLRVMNTTHALTAVINAAKQSMGIWVLSNDI